MKKIMLSMIAMVMLLVLALGVSAVSFGGTGTNDRVSNPSHTTTSNHDLYQTRSFTLEPEQDGLMTCNVVHDVSNFNNNINAASDNNLNITFGGNSTGTYTVSSDTAHNIEVRARLPANLNAVNPNSLIEESQLVANITCTVGDWSHSESVFMQRRNLFEITRIEVTYDDISRSITRETDRFRDIRAGTIMDLNLYMRNNYRRTDYVGMDVDIDIDCDSDIFLDYDSENTYLSEAMTDLVSFELEFDEDDIARGLYSCRISAIAIDDHGAIFADEFTVQFNVVRENYEIAISRFTLNPSFITCEDRLVRATVEYKNTGMLRDRNARIEIVPSSIGLSPVEFRNIDLDSTFTERKFSDLVIPESVRPGTYTIIANAYSRGSDLTDSKTIQITVPDCDPEPVEEPKPTQPTQPSQPSTSTDGTVVINPFGPQQNQTAGEIITTPTNQTSTVDADPDSDNTMIYVVLLVLLIVLLLAGIVGLLIYLFKA
ncbi:MAG: hypothetical protein ACMXYG_05735 [Candidatus Woesearchaeota archaeon]